MFAIYKPTFLPCLQEIIYITFNVLVSYIYTKIIVWCEDEERSIPLQVERKVKVKVFYFYFQESHLH